MIHAMLETQQQSDWWDDVPEDVQEEIDSAIQDVDRGKGLPLSVFLEACLLLNVYHLQL